MSEPSNADRAGRGELILLTYAWNEGRRDELAGSELCETLLTDLLADLMHYTNIMDMDFRRCLEAAEMHFDAEIAEERRAS